MKSAPLLELEVRNDSCCVAFFWRPRMPTVSAL